MASERKGGFEHTLTLEEIRRRQAEFASERDWEQYHTPRNLVLAKGEVKPGLPEFTGEERTHVGEELSDCLLYLIRLADRCGVDLSSAVLDKMRKNSAKYPKDKVRGSSDKYDKYTQSQSQPSQAPTSHTSAS